MASNCLRSYRASWRTLSSTTHLCVGRIGFLKTAIFSIGVRGGAIPGRRGGVQQLRLYSSERPASSRPRTRRVLLTLDPTQMATMGQEVFDISGLRLARLRTPRKASFALSYKKTWENQVLVAHPFPPGTKGVLYYYSPPGFPPQAGEVRFRKCDSLQQFHDGQDLELDLGQTWSLPLLNIVQSQVRRELLRELIAEPGLVDLHVLADIERIFRGSKVKGHGMNRGGLMLYDINQPFVADIHLTSFTVRLVTRQSAQKLSNFYPFWPWAGRRKIIPPPFRGRVRARLELSDMPEHAKRPTLYLRILEILQPIEELASQHFLEPPRAGELLMRRKKAGRHYTPWSYSPQKGCHNSRELEEFLKCRAADKAKFGV